MSKVEDADDIADLTTTDFFARAWWARSGEPFAPIAFAKVQLRDAIAAMEQVQDEQRPDIDQALAKARDPLGALEAAPA